MHRTLQSPSARRWLAIAALAAPMTLAAAPGAQADSISFIRGGNVWVTSTDGSQQVQVTTSGGYSYASRADDGTFIALHGRRLHRIAPTGQVTADFDTPVSGEQTAPNTSFFRGPYKPEISPDGTKVAYEYWHQAILNTPGCLPVGDPRCTDKRISVGIGYSHADRQTDWDEPGLGRQSGWMHPSWIGNDTLLMSDKSVRPNLDAIIDHPGDGNQTIAGWFEDTGVWYVRDGEVSRRGDAAAFVSTVARGASDPRWGQEDDQITIYRMQGAAPALPEQCFSFANPEARYASPSFSPDGSRVVWETSNRDSSAGATPRSLLVGSIPSQAGGCQGPTEGGATLIENASQPDWSPAPVPTIAAGAGGGNTGAAGGGGGGGAAGSSTGGAPGKGGAVGAGNPAPTAISVIVSKPSIARALAGQLSVRLTVPAAGKLSVTASRGRKQFASGTAKSAGTGPVDLKLKFTPAAKRLLRKSTTVSLTLRYRFKPAAGQAVTGTAKVTLRK